VKRGAGFRLRDHDPEDTHRLGTEDKPKAQELLAASVELLAEYQDRLYAQDRWAVLLIFQAMDAAGKDGAIKHVLTGVNPQGVQVFSFKAPSAEELDHDFLWRCARRLPERGRIGIFNRSYYEETLVVRVHPELLEKQHLPPELVGANLWKHRYQDIRHHERYLARNGVLIRKIFLNVSKQEQKRRFLARIDDPEKNWKFSAADVREREYWKHYMRAYEQTIRATATPHAPWVIAPADNKWFTRLVVASTVVEALSSLDLSYPKVSAERKRGLLAARAKLTSGKRRRDD